jgi:penicillin-binding protein 1A
MTFMTIMTNQTSDIKYSNMKRSVRIFWRIAIFVVFCFILVIVLAAAGVFGSMPSMKELENPTLLQTSEVYASDGTLMGKYYREHGNRSNVNYSDISKHVIDALIATKTFVFIIIAVLT